MKASNILSRSSRSFLRRHTLRKASFSRPSNASRLTPLFHQHQHHPFTTTSSAFLGLSPHSSDPEAPNTEAHDTTTSNLSAAEVSDSEYHEIADQYLDSLVLALEEKAEDPNLGLEVEYSAGVLTVSHPRGTYVLNKQPPNKQIWLSSPLSGPKRFDWVLSGAAQHEKEGSEFSETADDHPDGGKWVYLRDGTELSALLKKEVDVEIAKHGEEDVAIGREGPGGGGAKLDGD